MKTITTLLSILFLSSISAWAQYHGGFQGVVTDPTGALVPGATITATNNATGLHNEATSSDSGAYLIPALAGGTYSVTVEKTGFNKQVFEKVLLQDETVQSFNVTLTVAGTATQVVTVSADVLPVINTESADISGSITSKNIQNLPSLDRDPYTLMRLAPGTFGDGAVGNGGNANNLPGTNIGAGNGIFAVENGVQITANGSRQNANNFQIDGVFVNSSVWGGAPVVTPSEETVKEVKVISNNYSAENGRGSGAQVQVISQSGTNDYHGSAFFKWHRPGLNSYDRWNGMTPVQNADGSWGAIDHPREKDTQRFNQYGGSVGGPIIKNHLFAFFAYETQRNHSQTVATGWYVTPQFLQSAATAGGVSSKITSLPGEVPVYTLIIPENCAGVGLAATQCQNTSSGGLDLGSPLKTGDGKSDPTYGLAATPYGIGGGFDGVPDLEFLQTNSPTTNINAQYNGRLDYQATAKDLVAFAIYWTPVYTEDYNGPAYSANLYKHYSLAQAWNGLWNHTFDANLLNEVRIGGSGWKWNELTSNPQEPFGLPGIQFQPNGVKDYGGLGSSAQIQNLGAPGPSVFNQFTYSYRDTLTWIKGSHSIKFGADVTHVKFLDTAPWGAIPTYQFTNLWNFANDAPVQESDNFNPVTGQPSSVTKNLRDDTVAFFVQDDWKVSRNLTLNLGIRWEDYVPPTETSGNISNVVLGQGANVLTNLYIDKGGSLYNNTFTNFEPQIGFAWSPSLAGLGHRVSLRGGFGIGYNLEQFAITSNGRFNPPFLNSLTLSGSNILYAAGSNIHDINSFPSNPAALETFNIEGLPTGTPSNLTGFPQNFKPSSTYRYSLESQFDLGHAWMGSVGYSGSQSRHLTRQINNLNWLYYPDLNPAVQQVDWYANDANSHYNAFLAEVKHNFAANFEFDFQYQYAHTTDDGTQDYNTDLYVWNRSFTFGPSDFDVRNNYKIWGMYTPKFSRSGNNWVDKAVGGWTITGIFNIHSGFPWTPQFCPNTYIEYSTSNSGCIFPENYLGGATNSTSNSTFETPFGNFPKNAAGNGGSQTYFTTYSNAVLNAGIPPAPTNLYRNMFRGPGYFGDDVQIAKAFGLPKLPVLGENARLNLQANIYNLFNKTNLQNINNPETIGGPQFGVSQGGLAGRIVELQARFSF